jgi:hypothetical protein
VAIWLSVAISILGQICLGRASHAPSPRREHPLAADRTDTKANQPLCARRSKAWSVVNFLLFDLRMGSRLHKLKPYIGPSASGFIWGSVVFILYSLLMGPTTHLLDASQELAIWSTAGALIAFSIAFLGDQFA